MRCSTKLVALLSLLTIGPSVVGQTTWYVDDDNAPGPGTGTDIDPFISVQAAIAASASGDTIIVMPGRYIEITNLMLKTLHLRGSDPADPATVMNTVIDGNGAGIVMRVVGGQGPDTIIEGLTITGGYAAAADHASRGAGIHAHNTSPTIRNCVLTSNTALTLGGGLYVFNGSPVVSNCTMYGNAADQGGAVYVENGSPTFTNCRLTGNTASSGGGLFSNAAALPLITSTHICGNTADQLSGPFAGGAGNLIGEFCPPPVPVCPGDINGDGVVNVVDLLAVLRRWGSCPI